ncbi:MAG: hypothetical protein AB8H03_00865 [Saprospiraceae bacterium]
MKNIILFLSILFLVGCSDSQSVTNTELFIYLDYTEGQDYSDLLENDVEKYLTMMNVTEENDRNFGKVRIYPLHDISSSVSKTVKLKKGKSKLEGNRYIRQKELDKFKTQLIEKTSEINNSFTGKALNSSHIFSPLCKGIHKINNSNADRKVIVIYSDMLENSDLANFHSGKLKYENLKANFDGSCEFEDLSDCEVYIIHPIDKRNDNKIRTAENFWSKYMEEKGLDSDMWHFDTSIDI